MNGRGVLTNATKSLDRTGEKTVSSCIDCRIEQHRSNPVRGSKAGFALRIKKWQRNMTMEQLVALIIDTISSAVEQRVGN
jgi:hypothetical protein